MISAFRRVLMLFDKKQFLPTLEDVENPDSKELAKRLKGDSDKETLTNILEWQDRNIQYWVERGILELSWIFLTILIVVLYLIVFSPILILLYYYLISISLSASASQILVSAIFSVLLIGFIFQNALVRITYVLLLSYPVYQLEKIYLISSVKNPAINLILSLASLNGILFGVAILSLTYLMMSYYPIFRTEPLITRIKKILFMMKYTFQFSLPAG